VTGRPAPLFAQLPGGRESLAVPLAIRVAELGGRVVHTFDDLLVVVLPGGNELSAYRLPGVREVAMNGVNPGSRRAAAMSSGLAAWNAIAGEPKNARRTAPADDPLAEDALVARTVSLDAVRAASRIVSSVSGERLRLQEPAVAAATGLWHIREGNLNRARSANEMPVGTVASANYSLIQRVPNTFAILHFSLYADLWTGISTCRAAKQRTC
jgi:hypothetical protein